MPQTSQAVKEDLGVRTGRALDAFFENQVFRVDSSEIRLYRTLRVEFFRKYFPIAGSWWKKRFSKKSEYKGKTIEDLRNAYTSSEEFEAIHLLLALPVFTPMTVFSAVGGEVLQTLAWGVLNLAAGVYPVMNQRYTRYKLGKLIEIMEERGIDRL